MKIDEVALDAGGHAFRVRTYRPEAPGGAVLVWMHGGAFMFGDLDMPEADQVGRELAERGVAVVSVDYTLAPLDAIPALLPPGGVGPDAPLPPLPASDAPRARFPVASLQVAAAFDWAVANAAALGAEPGRVSVGGASAGGNLAASAAMRLRGRGGVRPASVLLVYPVLHNEVPAVDAELKEMLAGMPAFLTFPSAAMKAINDNYAGGSLDDPYVYPAGHDLRGLPPAYIINAEADRLRKSGEGFAAELALAGVDVTVVRERGTAHGYLNEPGGAAAIRTVERFTAWLG
ncbi:alpha/beta hydrolase fold domain-containing protein [Paractinoplanes durhamensis]|uniref:Esterase n=1 Tax=Paractinoplanes durhamensis TaxID=113563 RepID=A0ABQ3YY97_9ACTN|nr:alpha/beta hydrolase fold domain-containing protein [Actinoplanes durhamensis]GIE02499.1 esterase [Actinoplanes durhamensis]